MNWKRDQNRSTWEVPPSELANALCTAPSSLASSIFRVLAMISVGSLIVISICGYLWLKALGVLSLTDQSLAVITYHAPSDNSVVYDRDGHVIGEFFDRYHVYVPFEQIPPMMIYAILAIEDRSFFDHGGIDLKGIARAGIDTIKGGGEYRQGASTLTQQVVRNFLLHREKSIVRKIKEIALSLHLEGRLSKEGIFELYANSMFMGYGSYGVGAAAQRYFGRPLNELRPHEMALLAGLFQSPSRYNPLRAPELARKRQKTVIRAMYRSRYISREQALSMINAPLIYDNYEHVNTSVAPYFVDHVREEAKMIMEGMQVKNQGLRIYTTLDSKLQKLARKSFEQKEDHFKRVETWTNPPRFRSKIADDIRVEGALLSTDPRSGEILAMVGGRNYNVSQYNRATQGLRSPGSALKPLAYSLALAAGRTWADVFLVSPVSINGYRPNNYNKEEVMMEVTMLDAFYRSLNTVAVEIGNEIGIGAAISMARNLGIKSQLKEEPGLFLGSSDLRMTDLAQMYATFANMGTRVEMISISKILSRSGELLYQAPDALERSQLAIDPRVASLITDGMRQVFQRGTGAAYPHLARKHAGKTGTSNDSQDNWFCGYSSDLVSLVWVGTDDNTPMKRPASGATAALPVWADFIESMQLHRPSESFQYAKGLRSFTVDPKFGYRSSEGIPMLFISGSEPRSHNSDFESISSRGRYRDLYSH